MKRVLTLSLAAMGVLALSLGTANAAGVYVEGDTIIGIDASPNAHSNHPGGEAPVDGIDGDVNTKYLNFGDGGGGATDAVAGPGRGTGFIVTPGTAGTIIQSLQFSTANDADGRDPVSFALYGTNDAITSGNNSLGDAESWALIAEDATGLLPFSGAAGRKQTGAAVDITNGTAYNSYKLIFTETRSPNDSLMQVSEVQLFTGAGGTSPVLSGSESIFAVSDAVDWPTGENPADALDMDAGGNSKYLHFGREGTGLIVSNGSPTIVDSLQFESANDHDTRDPMTWTLYGTDDPVSSTQNSTGTAETWTVVDTGATGLTSDRDTFGSVQPVSNTTPYGAYKLVFDTLRDNGAANSMQVSEIVFGGTIVPEPTSLALVMLGLAACGASRRRS